MLLFGHTQLSTKILFGDAPSTMLKIGSVHIKIGSVQIKIGSVQIKIGSVQICQTSARSISAILLFGHTQFSVELLFGHTPFSVELLFGHTQFSTMEWLRLVGSSRLHVSFAEYCLFYRALLQKRPVILRSLLIVATKYPLVWRRTICYERWGAGVETQKNVRGEIKGWGRVPFNETYAPSLSTFYDGA